MNNFRSETIRIYKRSSTMNSLLFSIVVWTSWCHILVVMTYEIVVIVDEGRIYYSVGDHYFLLKQWDTCFLFLLLSRETLLLSLLSKISLVHELFSSIHDSLDSSTKFNLKRYGSVESKFFKRKRKLLQLLIIRCLSFMNVVIWNYKQKRSQ